MRCEAVECGLKAHAKGLCDTHYKRWKNGQNIDGHAKLQHSLPRGGLAALGIHRHHPFYLAWVNMKTRCTNPKATQWEWYGARGIRFDERWAAFANFHVDMWPTWARGLSLERRNNNENYSLVNCHWIPLGDQAKNRRPRWDR